LKFRAILSEKLTPEQQALAKAMHHIFGVKSGNIYIYELAFRHKSMASEVKSGCTDSYERLEFLGDAILGAVIAEFLFKKFPFKSEGFLTDLRSKIVCGKFLSKIAQKLGLDKLIHIQNNAHNKVVTSALGDVMEAVIGAVFIDKGFEATRKVILERIINLHVDVEFLVETETNFKSRLIEWAQKEKAELCFSLKNAKTVNGQKQYTVEVVIDSQAICEAIHNSIKECEQLAAERSIEFLKEEGRYGTPEKNN
jgi:ribonuclease III